MAATAPEPAGPRPLHPQVRTLWRILAALGTLITTLALAGTCGLFTGSWAVAVGAGLATAATVGPLGWWVAGEQWANWSYELGDDVLELRHGILTRHHSVVPYFRVQHIDVAAGPLERALGLQRLVVHTASATTDSVIPGLDASEARTVRQLTLDRAGRGDAV